MPDTDPVVSSDAGNIEDTTSVENQPDAGEETPALNLAEINARIDEIAETAAAKAELDAIRRATGHIPGLQSRLDSIQKTLDSYSDTPKQTAALNDKLSRLVSYLSDQAVLTPQQAMVFVEQPQTSDAVLAKLAEIEAKVGAQPQTQAIADLDPVEAARVAAWAEAEEVVVSFAQRLGVARNEIPEDIWTKAYQANPNDPKNGIALAAADLTTFAQSRTRRQERSAAAAGGNTSQQQAQRSGSSVTLDDLRKMTPQEIMKLDRSAVQAAMERGT